MKKVTKVLSTLLPSVFVLGLSLGLIPHFSHNSAGEDTAIYSDEPAVTSFDQPDVRYYAEEEEDEDVTVEVDKVILHYYNEAGGNKGDNGRAFYLWVTGVDGKEYNTSSYKPEEHNPPSEECPDGIVSVNTEDTMMTIVIDFSTSEFSEFANRSGLYFIIKYAMKSDTDLNWGGQSDDMFIRYADYPDAVNDQKVCELWTMNAAGGGIAILDSYNKTQVHGVTLAKFTDWKTIRCTLTKDTRTVNWKLYAYDQTYYKIKPKKRAEVQKWYLVKEGTGTGNFDIKFKYEAHVNMVYSLESHDPSTDSDPDMANLSKIVTVGLDNLYDSEKFHTYYEKANLNKALGVTYTAEATTFRVWSPVSANMKVLIYEKDTSSEYCGSTDEDVKKAYDKYEGYQMQYTTGGIWELTITGDLEGKYYNYQVDNSLGTNVIMDPYATSAGANGLRGLIYDKNSSKVKPDGWDALPVKWDGETAKGLDIKTPQQLSIYEVHIQDFTGDASWGGSAANSGKYLGFVEPSTTYFDGESHHAGVTTGYDHLKELGVNAVQIMPTFDHDNNEVAETPKYNWGYNPLNYNVPEGAYSSDPHDGYARVKEFRTLVLEMSKTQAHTRTIMDVVYNHVSSATGSNFHKLMPRYYFRYAMKDYTYSWEEWDDELGKMVTKYSTVKQGELWDGSGCHNEVASERPMMRKFIVDSLCMWAKDYKIKGFRFDLMGLIDFKTLNEAKKALYAIDPDIYIYGEGWTSGGYHGEGSAEYNEYYKDNFHNYGASTWQVYNECNNYKADGIYLGGFNDYFRNALRGGNDLGGGNKYPGSGWIQNGTRREGSSGWYTDWTALDAVGYGLWGLNYDIKGNGDAGNGDHTGRFPEQSVSYASCHDNWTLRDQFFQTLHDDTHPAEMIARASLETHAFIFASNSPAFILGGEEIFRTKTIPDSLIGEITDKSSYLPMYGKNVSHNSYNSPLEVNTFKWGNKVEFNVSGTRDGNPFSETLSNSVYHYTEHFATMIKAHANLEFKRGANISKCEEFVGSTSKGTSVTNIYWFYDNVECNCVAFQTNETFMYAHTGGYSSSDDLHYDTSFTFIDSYGTEGARNMYYLCKAS